VFDDLRFAWRRLRSAPGFTAVAILTLALAIGANTAIFSVADAVLFRPLPYPDPDRVHILQIQDLHTGKRYTLTPHTYLQAIDQHHRGLGGVGLIEPGPDVVVPSETGAERLRTAAATVNYFSILGIRPARGRLFDPADVAHEGRVAVLSYAAWRTRFGGDENIVGRAVPIGGMTFDVIGVLPRDLVIPSVFVGRAELVTVMRSDLDDPRGGTFQPIVRRKPGVTREQAQAEMDALIRPLAAQTPDRRDSLPVLEDVRSVLYPTGQPIMRFLLAAAGLVLLIGCANLANMLLARGQRRERETGVRAALGASRLRLVRPVIFESILVGLAGAALALATTALASDVLLRQVPRAAYGSAPVGVGMRVVWFALALGLAGGFAFSVVPAWRAARVDAQALLQGRVGGSAQRRARLGRPMAAVQVALAIVLVFGAVIAGRAFVAVLRVPLGFTPEQVIVIRLLPPREAKTGLARQDFYVRAVEALRQRPDVVLAGAVGSLPLGGAAMDEGIEANGSRVAGAGIVHVLPGYFDTVGIRLVRGRSPNWQDVQSGADVAVVSEAASRTLFAGRDPLNATFTNGRGRQFAVVGVVSDVRASLDGDSGAPAYVIAGANTRMLTIVARVRGQQAAVLAGIKRDMSRLAGGQPSTVEWWTDSISALTSYRNPRFQTIVLGTFATLALALMAVGIFGVVAFLVAIRTHEMGIRLALGATPSSLVRLMVGQSLAPVGVGLVVGLLATRGLTRLAEAHLFAVQVRDPVTLAGAAATVVVAALLAAYLPARQAMRADPTVVLRAE
jgi:predicted permease